MRKLRLGPAALAAMTMFAIGSGSAGSAMAAPPLPAGSLAGPPLAAGSYTTIAIPGGTQVMPSGISDSGVIVGCFQSARGQRGFVDRHGRISTIADPAAGPHGGTCPLSIDDSGVIVGSYTRRTGATHGFVDRHGMFTSITAPGAGTRSGTGTVAVGINDSNVIVGFTLTLSPSKNHGFVLKKGKFSLVKVPTGKGSSVVARVLNGIADDGAITGWYQGAKVVHTFIDRSGKFVPIAVPHAVQTFAACISPNGSEVVGIYTTPSPGRSTTDSPTARGPTARCATRPGQQVPRPSA